MLLKGADATIIATMDHLAVANLLRGNPDKAAKVSSRYCRQMFAARVPF